MVPPISSGTGHTYLKLVFGSGELTHFAGVLLLHRFFGQIQLRSLLSKTLRFGRHNTRYSVSDMVMSLLYPVILGLGRVETTGWLRHNGAFRYLTGLAHYPSATTLRRFLGRLGRCEGLTALEGLHDRMRAVFLCLPRVPNTVVFDLDSTVLPVYGRREGAALGFNPKKQGRLSYQPLVCVEGMTGDCWAGGLRPGNIHVLNDAQAMLEHALAKLPPGVRRVRARADAAFHDGGLISYLEGGM